MERPFNEEPIFENIHERAENLKSLNLKLCKRIKVLEKENSRFKSAMDLLQTVQNQRDFYREKLVSLDHDIVSLKLSKKKSDERVLVLEKELEDLKNSRVPVCAIEDKKLIDDFTAREKTLRNKFVLIEGERDKLLSLIDNLKKNSLSLEESNYLLESNILKLKNDLTDSSRFDSDGNGSSCSHASNAKAKTIICFRGSTNSKDARKDHTFGVIPPVYTCSYCGRNGHLRRFCFDLGRGPRNSKSSILLVPKTPRRRVSSVWVRKSLLEELDFRQVDSRLLAHDSSLAISYR